MTAPWVTVPSAAQAIQRHKLANMDKRGNWIAVLGVVAAVFGGSAITWMATAPSSKLPYWPAIPIGVIGAVGFYGLFATLLSWWPLQSLGSPASEEETLGSPNDAFTPGDLMAVLREALRSSRAPSAPDEARELDSTGLAEVADAVASAAVTIDFRTHLMPDEISVYEAVAAIARDEPVVIRWPAVSNEIYERLASRRSVLTHELNQRGVEPGQRLLSAFQQFDEQFEAGRVRRDHAASRVPLMWKGMAMAEYWGPPALFREAFREALQHFLVIANLNAIIHMAAVQFPEDPSPPEELRPRGDHRKPLQNPTVAAALGCAPPFWTADVSIGGENLYVFAPRTMVERAYHDSLHGRANTTFLVRFVIPELEERLIGEPTPRVYRPSDLEVHKIRDEEFEEVTLDW